MRLSASSAFFGLFLGSIFSNAWAATVCVNVNALEDPAGSGICANPAFTDPKQILIPFLPDLHDIKNNSQVIDRGNETTDSSTNQVIDVFGTPPQPRKIYTCRPPYTVNTGAMKCEFKHENHACNAGDASVGVFPSEVSLEVGGATKVDRFQNAVNKKLACCLNDFGLTGPKAPVKFDCIENSKKHYVDFNELWTSSDDSADGGQLNALVLTNSMGKPLTGFYSLSGSRCNEFNEFAGEIQPGKISLPNHGNAFTPLGLPLEMPTSGAYALMRQRFAGLGIKVPTSVADRRRCPVLVRAAIMAQCPSNAPFTAVQKTADINDVSGLFLHRRCSVASSVQIQIRIEQLYEFETEPRMIPSDTIIEAKNAATISIHQLIAGKYGNQCPPGSTRSGDACVY